MRRWMLDSCFLIKALSSDPTKRRPHAELAMRVALAMVASGEVDLLVAATVEAELLAHADDVPWLDVFEPIAFDREVAKWLPRLKQTKPEGMLRGYWSYGTITLSCAIAGGAEAIVSDDEDYARIIERCNGERATMSPPQPALPIRSMWPEEVSEGDIGRVNAFARRDREREAAATTVVTAPSAPTSAVEAVPVTEHARGEIVEDMLPPVVAHLPSAVVEHLPSPVVAHLPSAVVEHLPSPVVEHLPSPAEEHLPNAVAEHLPVPVGEQLPIPGAEHGEG